MKSVKVQVLGRVQGVSYRASTEEKAQALGLVGWVRNEEDGSVTFVAQGSEQAIDQLLAWAKEGPALARVSQLKVETIEAQALDDFKIHL